MKKDLVEFVGNIALALIAIIYASFSSGFVILKFWYWFLLPVFSTAPQINFWQAVGLTFIVGLFKSIDTNDKYVKGNKIESKINWGMSIILPWVILLLGWVVKLFIP